jgi:hypothetical protein
MSFRHLLYSPTKSAPVKFVPHWALYAERSGGVALLGNLYLFPQEDNGQIRMGDAC